MQQIHEADWRVLRQLHPVALDRFCEGVLSELSRAAGESGKTAHERYLAVFDLLQGRRKDLGDTFDDMRRSTALLRLMAIRHRGLLTDVEFARFSSETREIVQRFLSQ